MNLTEEQKQDIERLSALGYLPVDIAILIKVPVSVFISEFENENSEIYYHFRRGEIQVRANADMELMKLAEGGNLTAIQILHKQEKEKRRKKLLYNLEI